MVLNKPMGLAVQGGSGTVRHVDGMMEALRTRDGVKPRLVHRIDKDTSGILLIAKTRLAAATLAKSFRSRSARKIYWALVAGVPKVKQGRISTYLAKGGGPERRIDARRQAWRRECGSCGDLLRGRRERGEICCRGCRSSPSPAARTSCARMRRIWVNPIVGDPK